MLEAQIKPLITLIIVIYLITLCIIYSKTNENITDQRESFAFKGMLFSFMLYGLVDLRFTNDNFYADFPHWFTMLVTELGFATMSLSCYFWFIYVSSDTKPRRKFAQLWYIATSLPLLVSFAFIFTPLNKNLFVITDTLELRPLLFFLTWMDYIYLILATIISLIKRHRAKTRIEKRRYASQILFILFFTVSGFMVGFLMNLPSIELCIIPIVLKIFVEIQDSKIYTDALTRLNNRRRISDYINEELPSCSLEKPLCIIMIDIDFFKSINDILGHEEGDRALIAFSNALTKVTQSKDAMASRWGGDEFVIAGKDMSIAENLREKISKELEKNSNLSFTPSFSIGIYKCTTPSVRIDDALVAADAELYKDKEIQHQKTEEFHRQLNKAK